MKQLKVCQGCRTKYSNWNEHILTPAHQEYGIGEGFKKFCSFTKKVNVELTSSRQLDSTPSPPVYIKQSEDFTRRQSESESPIIHTRRSAKKLSIDRNGIKDYPNQKN